MKIVGIIPARYGSSRFTGKPLADIHGKPMIIRVCEQVSKSSGLDAFFVATDDASIELACKSYGFQCCMTSKNCSTGTDRLAEAALSMDADMYVNIQGDEPLIEPEVISQFVDWVKQSYDNSYLRSKKVNVEVFNSMVKIEDPMDLINPTIPKVVVNNDNYAIYMSRSPIPFPQYSANRHSYFRQIGLYAFTSSALQSFANIGMGFIEKKESIEILRFIENLIPVRMLELATKSIAVDTPDDLKRVLNNFQSNRK